MQLDLHLTQLGTTLKHMVLLDLSFPQMAFLEFKRAYPNRYLHVPSRQGMALEMAAGMASLGLTVLVYGLGHDRLDLPDETLSVKLLISSEGADWANFDEQISRFGASLALIPEGNSRSL